MSWGWFVDLDLHMPSKAFAELRSMPVGDVVLSEGWSGLADRSLEARLGGEAEGDESFAVALAASDYRTAETIHRITRGRSHTEIRICVLLDKSLLARARPLAAALHAAVSLGARGTLRLVNDGTYAGENGVVLTLDDGAITREGIVDPSPIVDALGTELFRGGTRTTDVAPSPSARPIGRNPMTGKPIYASAKPTSAKKPAAAKRRARR